MPATAIQTRPSMMDDPLQSLGDLGRDVALGLARTTYTGAYFMAYGMVFSAVLIAKSVPKKNPVVKGFRDGGRAAREVLDEGGAQ